MKTTNRKTKINQNEYCRILESSGYFFAGAGLYGTVYVKDDHAVKVCNTKRNGGYLDYVKSVAKSTSPFAPKFYELTMYRVERMGVATDEDFFVVTMEKLVPLHWDDNWDEIQLVEEISTFVDFATSSYFTKTDVSRKKKEVKKVFGKQSNDFFQVCNKIITLANRKGHATDLHDANVMIRSETNQLVITDPLC